MLQYRTIDQETLGLLKKLMAEPKTFEHTDWNEIKRSLNKRLDEFLKSL